MHMQSMKSKIRKPVLTLIIVFPLITLLLFNIAIRVYVNTNAKNELQTASKTMETFVKKELSGNLPSFDDGSMNNTFIKLYKTLHPAKLASNTEMLLYNKRQKLLYPRGQTTGFMTQPLIDEVTKQLSSYQDKKVYSIRIGRSKYFLLSYRLPNTAGERPIVVFVVQTDEINALIFIINLILISVLLLGTILASVIINKLSVRIAQPVTKLCTLTKNIGKGEFLFPAHLSNEGDTIELNLLYQSIREMSARLDAYDKSQKTFLQNASHELKTPLMSIQGYAEGIANGIIPDVKHGAEIINSESKRLNTLVEELLTLSRIESQTYVRELIVTNLCDVLKEYTQRMGGYAAKLEKQLILTLPDNPITILADDTLLSQTVMNITFNCLRYAKTAAHIALLEDEKNAVIRITDDGNGISPADLPHIFDRFYKGNNGNFGLGLAIAKSAVEFMSGIIQADNDQNGAVFEITLPLAK
jgi:two-component system, OmpR family, sensor histidine kinase CssS